MGPSFSVVTIVIPSALLLVGLALFIIGWRGRVEGSQPHCRKCGFNLFGLPDTSTNCPECGSDLRKPHATLSGHLVRRRGMLWAGGILLFMALVSGGAVGTVLANDGNFNPYKPLWMLVGEVGNSDPTVSQPAMREISRRMSDGKISDAKIKALADAALELQANPQRPWVEGWGNFIESARKNGKLSDAAWDRYLKQAPNLSLEVRAVQDRANGTLPYWIVFGPARVGNGSRLHTRLNSRNITLSLNDVPLPPENGAWSSESGLGPSGTSKSGHGVPIASVRDQLKDGPQTLRVKGTFELIDPAAASTAPPLMSIPFDLTGHWTLQSSRPTVTLKKDDAKRPAVEKAINLGKVRLQHWPNSEPQLEVNIDVSNLPVSIGFDIFARQGDREWKVSRLATPAGNATRGWGTGGEVKGFTGDTVDIILRPSTEAAAATTDTFEVWDGEIEFKNVKVELPQQAPPAPTTGKQ